MPKFYPLGDWLSEKEKEKFGVSNFTRETLDIKAIFSGEKRCPKKGEWYLSGAEVMAYRAPNDLTSVYHIAKLVKTKTTTKTTIEIV